MSRRLAMSRRPPRPPTPRSRPASIWWRRRSATCATSPCGRWTCWPAADLVLAEDTRVTGKLLSAYGLSGQAGALRRARRRAGAAQGAGGAGRGRAGGAGVRRRHAAGLRPRLPAGARGGRRRACGLSRSPAPRRLLAALSVAGLPTDRFLFAGFPPPKSAARGGPSWRSWPASRATLVFFESGSRLADSLADMAAVFGDRARPRSAAS